MAPNIQKHPNGHPHYEANWCLACKRGEELLEHVSWQGGQEPETLQPCILKL